jgi:hypothetical protein
VVPTPTLPILVTANISPFMGTPNELAVPICKGVIGFVVPIPIDDALIIPDEILLISYEPVAVRAPPTNTLPVVTSPINVEVPFT